MINFSLSTEQQQIVDTARAFFADHLPLARFRPNAAGRLAVDATKLKDLADLGFFRLGLPEERGGLGLGMVYDYLFFQEAGCVLSQPMLLATTLGARIAAFGNADALREEIVEGKCPLGIAVPLFPTELANPVSGRFFSILGSADDIVVAWTPQGAMLLDSQDACSRLPVRGMDDTVITEILDFKTARPLALVSAAPDDIALRAAMLIAAMAAGMARSTAIMAADYAKMRKQFGKVIGSFQSIKHLCVDMACRAEAAATQTAYAAMAHDHDPASASAQIASACLVALNAAIRNSEDNIQVHGGIGFTAELGAHLFLKRAHLLKQIAGMDERAQEIILNDLAASAQARVKPLFERL